MPKKSTKDVPYVPIFIMKTVSPVKFDAARVKEMEPFLKTSLDKSLGIEDKEYTLYLSLNRVFIEPKPVYIARLSMFHQDEEPISTTQFFPEDQIIELKLFLAFPGTFFKLGEIDVLYFEPKVISNKKIEKFIKQWTHIRDKTTT